MNKKITFTGGEPDINFDDILRDPVADRAALFAIMKAFNISTNENFIISGCVTTLDTGVDVDVTAGYIFLNEEILQVEAQTVLNGGTLDLYKYVKATTYDPNGNKTFNDSTARQTWQKNRGIVTAATAPILTTELDVISGDRIEQKIIALFRATSDADASTTVKGIVERATSAEAIAATDDLRFITPKTLNDVVSGGLITKILEIGDWDMNADANNTVTHGIADFTKIRTISVIIIDDAAASVISLEGSDSAGATRGSVTGTNTTFMSLSRVTGAIFDATTYDQTPYNRGWVTIQYAP